ncbi:hypothetical protein ACFOOM_01050 [Streptomyces echinoruber]|uniref:Uncharacterized protein n=1 Tax=Streptomyces echinoruber TaxID=68898 RepID=A0A918V6A4_9ACTN|nr:hypothetical protein [Streptomyces echinoruber]GGZ73122.1 hypothetical protein GCM10010389_08240 [Streptomyces echinoruber]
MASLPAYITTGLRFPTTEILCKGDRAQRGCAAADGEPAYAIHTFEGRHFCGYHSPFDNEYVPCADCGEKPALVPVEGDAVCDDCSEKAHVCDETKERAAYGQYISDGLADTDGHFAPVDFEAWRTHYHRAIGYKEPRTEKCTETECKAPVHERRHYWNTGTQRKVRHTHVCGSCHERKLAEYRGSRRAA